MPQISSSDPCLFEQCDQEGRSGCKRGFAGLTVMREQGHVEHRVLA